MELTFKVVDQNDDPLNGVTVTITKGGDSETLEITENGEIKAENKYAPGTAFTLVTVQKEGYTLVTDVTQGIMVDARQSENTFSFEMSIESVRAISFIAQSSIT